MDDNRKTIVGQWLVPAGILLMVLAIMLFNFITKSRLSANDTVTRNMADAAAPVRIISGNSSRFLRQSVNR